MVALCLGCNHYSPQNPRMSPHNYCSILCNALEYVISELWAKFPHLVVLIPLLYLVIFRKPIGQFYF